MSHRARADNPCATYACPDEYNEQASAFIGDTVEIIAVSRAAEFDAGEERFFRFRVLNAVLEVLSRVAIIPLEFGHVHQDSTAIHCIYKRESVKCLLSRNRANVVEMRGFVRRLPFGREDGVERGGREVDNDNCG